MVCQSLESLVRSW